MGTFAYFLNLVIYSFHTLRKSFNVVLQSLAVHNCLTHVLGMTSVAAVPILVSAPAMAGEERCWATLTFLTGHTGWYNNSSPLRQGSKIIVAPKETVPVTLTVAKTFAHLRKES